VSALPWVTGRDPVRVIRTPRPSGFHRPHQSSKVFDDFEWADLFSPRLTTMVQADADIGRESVVDESVGSGGCDDVVESFAPIVG